jgi:glycosyltransferase involved in cell wall biosynthesis
MTVISIITVVRNNPLVAQALASVLGQQGVRVQSIVVDGASSDSTLAAIEPFKPRLAHFISEPDRGIYSAMNKGLDAAAGDVVGVLNADDVYEDAQVLADVALAFEQDPSLMALHGDLVYTRADDRAKLLRNWRSRPFVPGAFAKGWMPPHPAFFARRQAFVDHGFYDTRYKVGADFELMLRFLEKHQLKSRHLARCMVRMRWGGASNQSVSNVLLANRECWQACKAHGLKPGPYWWFMARKVGSKLGQWV